MGKDFWLREHPQLSITVYRYYSHHNAGVSPSWKWSNPSRLHVKREGLELVCIRFIPVTDSRTEQHMRGCFSTEIWCGEGLELYVIM